MINIWNKVRIHHFWVLLVLFLAFDSGSFFYLDWSTHSCFTSTFTSGWGSGFFSGLFSGFFSGLFQGTASISLIFLIWIGMGAGVAFSSIFPRSSFLILSASFFLLFLTGFFFFFGGYYSDLYGSSVTRIFLFSFLSLAFLLALGLTIYLFMRYIQRRHSSRPTILLLS